MAEPFLGQIVQGGWNFAPRGWAMCNGQLMSISQNTALFSLLGTSYGGDGVTTFGLPNLQGRLMMHFGGGPGLTPRVIGEVGGTETATLTQTQMPIHTHLFNGAGSTFSASAGQPHASAAVPALGSVLGHSVDILAPPTSSPAIYCPNGTATPIALGGLNVAGTISNAGGSQPFAIMNPFLCVVHVIALEGIFPSRN